MSRPSTSKRADVENTDFWLPNAVPTYDSVPNNGPLSKVRCAAGSFNLWREEEEEVSLAAKSPAGGEEELFITDFSDDDDDDDGFVDFLLPNAVPISDIVHKIGHLSEIGRAGSSNLQAGGGKDFCPIYDEAQSQTEKNPESQNKFITAMKKKWKNVRHQFSSFFSGKNEVKTLIPSELNADSANPYLKDDAGLASPESKTKISPDKRKGVFGCFRKGKVEPLPTSQLKADPAIPDVREVVDLAGLQSKTKVCPKKQKQKASISSFLDNFRRKKSKTVVPTQQLDADPAIPAAMDGDDLASRELKTRISFNRPDLKADIAAANAELQTCVGSANIRPRTTISPRQKDPRTLRPKNAEKPRLKDSGNPGPKDAGNPGPKDGGKLGPKDAKKPRQKDGEKPGPNDAVKPRLKDGGQPGPKDAVKPRPKDANKPGPKDADKPGPNDAVKPRPKDGRKPGPKDADKPGLNDAVKPRSKDGGKPGPKDADKPGPNDAVKPRSKDGKLWPKTLLTRKSFIFKYDYSFRDVLGKGSYGKVYKGKRRSDGKEVAIKIMERTDEENYLVIPGFSKPLLTEVALMLKMREAHSPFVLEMYDWYEDPGRFTLVLEYPQTCETLWDFIYFNARPISESAARPIMYQAVQAVQDCLNHGVFHSDVHLGNFLLERVNRKLTLIDFGLGHLLTDDGYNSKDFRGAPQCTPPEIHTKPKYYAMPTNVWALGIVLYSMVHQRYPFPRKVKKSHKLKISKDYFSKEIRHLIKWCLHMNPTKRPTIQQILDHDWFKIE